MKKYLGAKSGSGVYQAIINLLPPHDTYIEAFLGTGAVLQRKEPSLRDIGIDKCQSCVDYVSELVDAELVVADAMFYLADFDFVSAGRTVVYCDPPYLPSTRSSYEQNQYDNDLDEAGHCSLLELLVKLPCKIILSGYQNALYDDFLKGWRSVNFQAMSQGGVRTETLWCNFEPGDMHYHTYAGKDFTDRQRIQRKANRWATKLKSLPPGERQAIFAALIEALAE